jgi:hypothetical protein
MRKLAYLPLAAIVGFAACDSAGNPQAETAAVAAARAWLSLIDNQQYAQAWEQAAELFRKNKRSAVETITPMRDPDGQWRVSGYFIK